MSIKHEVEIQRAYYAKTARQYERQHVDEADEHYLALNIMVGATNFLQVQSILDIGSGTGRAVAFIKNSRPEVEVVGIEPVKELREVGYSQGLSIEELREGNALALDFNDNSVDLVCEFGVLHHVRTPDVVISEMLRVARKAIFLSDSNNFGHGSPFVRFIKQAINAMGLWGIADFIKTRGKGYTVSEGDGLGYSYSVFNNYCQIRRFCSRIHVFNLSDAEINPYRTASTVALLGIKR